MYAKEEPDLTGGAPTGCFGCGQPIQDRFLLTVLEKNWHVSCVRCNQCGQLLDHKCFFRNGKIYCRDDFYRLFGPRCGGCGEGIAPTDLVRRARDKPFHLACFVCNICRKQLSTGEELFIIDRDRFVCKEDFHNIKSQEYGGGYSDEEDDMDDCSSTSGSIRPPCITPLPPSLTGLGPGSLSPKGGLSDCNSNSLGANILGGPDQLQGSSYGGPGHKLAGDAGHKYSDSSLTGSINTTTGSGTGNTSLDSSASIITKIKTEDADFPDLEEQGDDLKTEQENRSPDGDSGKRRGPRTTIKAKQLEVLKTAFNQTPKPTRHIREQLAKETGLSMRVIQVWFQNKRSKERRMKQLTSGMLPRGFFGGPFGDFGFGHRFPPHPDFFPGGPIPFMGGHPGLPPSMEQPLPMSGCLPPDQFPVPTSMADLKGGLVDPGTSLPPYPSMQHKHLPDMSLFGMSKGGGLDGSLHSMPMDMHRTDFCPPVSGCESVDGSDPLGW